jgi:hypothetical protein
MAIEINSIADLRASIKTLEQQKEAQKDDLVKQFHAVAESLKPANILKRSFSKVIHAQGMSEKLLNAGLSIGMGLLSKKLFLGNTPGIARKLIGTVMELGVAGMVSKKSASLKRGALNLLSKLFKPRGKKVIA